VRRPTQAWHLTLTWPLLVKTWKLLQMLIWQRLLNQKLL
jgi:hypothetical protein